MALGLLSQIAMAEKIISGVDIINNSDIPLRITYVTACRSLPPPPEGGSSKTVCDKEETIELSPRNTGHGSITVVPPGTDDGVGKSIFVKKIVSQFGEQEFPVADEGDELAYELYQQKRFRESVNICVGFSGISGGVNMFGIILDNYGTNKVYCSSHWLSR